MLKLYIFSCLLLAVTATNAGYDYHNSGAATTHHTSQQQHHQPAAHTPKAHDSGYEKHYYFFTAPEEHFDQGKALQKVASETKKNLQVIFIKPPENHAYEKAVHNLAQNAVEQKTHIYVLSKEPDHAALANKVQHASTHQQQHHKPEVHYVKYHTPAEAQQVQHSIVQQYGGKPSDIVHLGSAPVASVASKEGQPQQHHHQQASASVNREYLAPAASSLSVANNYAKNFLPSGVDVVPGSSYIPPVLRF